MTTPFRGALSLLITLLFLATSFSSFTKEKSFYAGAFAPPTLIRANQIDLSDTFTFTGTLNSTGGGSLSQTSINNIQHAEKFPGATADVQITNCLAAVSNGGTCDARGYGATTQSIAATITVNNNQMLLCDPATTFQPASAALTLFTPKAGSHIAGCTIDFANQGSYSGNVFTYSDNYRDTTFTVLENIHLTASALTQTGCGVNIVATSATQSVYTLSLRGIYVIGLSNVICVSATGANAFVNGIHAQDIHGSFESAAYTFTASSSGIIQGNQFVNIDSQSNGGAGNAVYMTTATGGNVTQNSFYNVTFWDYTTAININTPANAYQNMFAGYWNGSVTDSANANYYLSNGVGIANPSYYASYNSQDQFIAAFAGTSQRDIHFQNTGGQLFIGIDNSTGSAFTTGGYNSVWYSPALSSYFITPNSYFSGNVGVASGTTVIYRCLTAGAARAGTLTSVSADCGTSVDTGLRTP